MVISMMKPKWFLQLYWKCFCSGLHMILECRRDTKLRPVSGASQYLYPEGQSQQTKRGNI